MTGLGQGGDGRRNEFEKAFVATLITDAEAAIERWRASGGDVQQARRDLVRSLHATIDGVVWAFREYVRTSAQTMELLTPAEEAVLSETNFQVSERGTISVQPRFLPLLGVVRLVARIATKINSAFTADFDGKEWADFRAAVVTRNRLTHPKVLADLAVSSDEIDQVIASFFWILDVSVRAMEASVDALRIYLEQIEQVVQGLKAGDPEILEAYRQVLRGDE